MATKYSVLQKFRLNSLARLFYKMQGYNVDQNYDFSTARHPQEKLMWEQAVLAEKFYAMTYEETPEPKKKRRSMTEISEDIKKNNERKPRAQLEKYPICESCGKPNATTCVRFDPFAAEINNEDIEVFWCDDCTEDRAGDI